MLTAQEIFDKVYTHLIHQSARATNEGGCAYRAPKNMKCAAGVLIKDEHYDRMMEGMLADHKPVKEALIKSDVNMDDQRIFILVLRLQAVHDQRKVAFWSADLERVAKDFELTIPDIGL